MPATRLTSMPAAGNLGAEQQPDHDRWVRQQDESHARLAGGSDRKQAFHSMAQRSALLPIGPSGFSSATAGTIW